MVGQTPQWDARRLRTPIPRALPGYMLMPYTPGGLLYVYGASSPTMWVINPENGQIVHEGQPGIQGDLADSGSAPSVCPLDGSITVGNQLGGTPQPHSLGLLNRSGDPMMGFAYQYKTSPSQQLVDSCNLPSGTAAYSLGGNNNLILANKSSSITNNPSGPTFDSVGADSFGIDCDRAGNLYFFHSAKINPTGYYVNGGTGAGWTATPASGNNPGTRCICVGPPEPSGGNWFQSVYVSSSTFLTKYDCRTGTQLATVATRYTNLAASGDGVYGVSSVAGVATIFKLNLDTLAVLWSHNPTTVETPTLTLTGAFGVDQCGDVFYVAGPKANGAYELRKVHSADGTIAWVKQFSLPWASPWVVPDCGRVGGYSFCSEPWVLAGKPPIQFS
jgi:hypothetical protein